LIGRTPNTMVRTLSFTGDGKRLVIGGDDKSVLVYGFGMWQGDRPTWQYERTIRWQVQRGPRGTIFATDLAGDTLAIAGYGAMQSLGEILLVSVTTGQVQDFLMDEERGNLQRITSLAFAPGSNGHRLLALDMHGRLVAWNRDTNTGQWSATLAVDDPDNKLTLRPFRSLHPLAMLDANSVVIPKFFDKDTNGPRWQLQRIRLDAQTVQTIAVKDEFHQQVVTAMAAAADGSLFVSADAAGNVYLWETSPRLVRIKLPALDRGSAAVALAVSPDNQRLAIGVFHGPLRPGEVRWMDISNRRNAKLLQSFPLPDACSSVAISPDGDFLTYASGSQVWIRSTSANFQIATELAPQVQTPVRVAFPVEEPYYRLGIATRAAEQGTAPITELFDTSKLQLENAQQLPANRWLRPDEHRGTWGVASRSDNGRDTYWLMEGSEQRARVPLEIDRHGVPTSVCWIPDSTGKLKYFALGTAGQGNIHLFGITNNGTCPRLREFRGHSGRVVSLCHSKDLKYLASASEDGTVAVWRLDADQPHPSENDMIDRWGVTFAVADGILIAQDVREDGPLYFRGVRTGDQIDQLRVVPLDTPDGPPKSLVVVEEMLRQLEQGSRDQLVVFDYRRGLTAQKSFASYPAWHPVASLFLDTNNEWAYWTPQGYYEASFEGHKLFGWQINRGPRVSPDFYRASQFQKTLERPDLMSELLKLGSLEATFRQARLPAPANSQFALRDQTELMPHVEIIEPRDAMEWQSPTPHIRAVIRVPQGERLLPPKAYTNGVIATESIEVSRQMGITTDAGIFDEYTYQWIANVPSDRQIAVQVFAATVNKLNDSQSVVVTRPVPQSSRPSRLFVAAAAIDRYRDAQVPQLTASVANAQSIVDTLKAQAASLYLTDSILLRNENVTVPGWQVVMEQLVAKLSSEVTPDDVLVVFLSGHGVRDETTDRYYYLGANARYADVLARQYESCLSFEEFQVFADLPCRKLVVLDTCHSGAIEPLQQRQLKTALRALQEDVVFTLTASEGTQVAVESRFAKRLEEGLRGAADLQTGDRNHIVDFKELAEFVKRAVAADGEAEGVRQRPMAGPSELLPYIQLPLTSIPVTFDAPAAVPR
jgi:WD40 repeat protein